MRFLLDEARTTEARRKKVDRTPVAARVVEATVELDPKLEAASLTPKYGNEIRSWLVGLMRKRWPGTNWIRVG